ncbi:astacin [Folsomia candida]|uniref:astacin n=1 Tax=Folsomia candida TaxID=158441 RepID=UPI000B8F7213|nr:astacin [Folsomia candida]
MMKVSILLLLGWLGSGAFAVPVGQPLPPSKPTNYTLLMEYPDFVIPSFDIKYTEEQLKSRSGLVDERYRWRNGFIVHPSRDFTASEYQVINDALYELWTHLCIPVLIWPQNSNPTGDYVEIVRGGVGTGCWSYLGRLGGRQNMNLQYNGCIVKYIVIHESIHALGYDHEQARTDRDGFVNILWNNIIPSQQHNFNIRPGSTTFGVPYDTNSIMQYASTSFSQNGQPTIVTKSGGQIPTNRDLTGNDVQKLKRMYNC